MFGRRPYEYDYGGGQYEGNYFNKRRRLDDGMEMMSPPPPPPTMQNSFNTLSTPPPFPYSSDSYDQDNYFNDSYSYDSTWSSGSSERPQRGGGLKRGRGRGSPGLTFSHGNSTRGNRGSSGRGNRGGSNRGRGGINSDVFINDMALIEAAEKEYNTSGVVDFNKIKEAITKMSNKGVRGGGSRGGSSDGGGMSGRGRGRGNFRGGSGGFGFGNNDFGAFKKQRATPYDYAAGFGAGNRGKGNNRGTRGGTSRGRGRFASVAPVHSLASVTNPNPDNMSVAEKMRRFALFIRNDVQVNDIQKIENSVSGSKLNMKAEYNVEDLLRVHNRMMFTGQLSVGGVFLARTFGHNKKEVKHECYSKAVEILKTRTVVAIMKLHDIGIEQMREELSASFLNQPVVNLVDIAEKVIASKQPADTGSESGFMGVAGGIFKLVEYLKSGKAVCPNAISELEQSFTASYCGLAHKYVDVPTRLDCGKVSVTGKLTIGNDILIAADTAASKKEAKLATYEQAVEFLKNKSITDIMHGIGQHEADAVPVKEFLDDSAMAAGGIKSITRPNDSTYNNLLALKSSLPTLSGLATAVNLLDVTAIQYNLLPSCAYMTNMNSGKTSVVCELYIDNIFIAACQDSKRKDAQASTYAAAFEVLRLKSVDDIWDSHKRLDPEYSTSEFVEVVVKGASRTGQSNLQRLNKMKLDPSQNEKTWRDLILLEHHDWSVDRKRHAFGVLSFSTTQNNMLFEWNIQSLGTFFKCSMYIQKEKVGEASAPSKSVARSLAAADTLFKLYQSQNTLKLTNCLPSEGVITYAEIQLQGEKLKELDGGKEGGDDMVPVLTEMTGIDVVDQEPLMANKWVLMAMDETIRQFKEKADEDLNELYFATDFPAAEHRYTTHSTLNHDLRCMHKMTKNNNTVTISKKHMPEFILKIVEKNDGSSGKYSIIDKKLLPNRIDIEAYIMSHGKKNN